MKNGVDHDASIGELSGNNIMKCYSEAVKMLLWIIFRQNKANNRYNPFFPFLNFSYAARNVKTQ